MRIRWMLLAMAISGCSGLGNSTSDQQGQLVVKDQSCAQYKNAAACTADTKDNCHWVEALAATPGSTAAGGVIVGGLCIGDSGNNPCVISTQCSRATSESLCDGNPDCDWGPAACPVNTIIVAGAPSPDATCSNHACGPRDTCVGLDSKDCQENPECELLVEACPQVVCAPTPVCAPGTACPQVIPCVQPPCPPTTPVCVHKPIVCGGAPVAGGGGTTTGSSGSTPSNPGTSPTSASSPPPSPTASH